jgi:hypothetical protein
MNQPQLSRNERNNKNVGKTCAPRLRRSPHQRFPCRRQAHHRLNVRVPRAGRDGLVFDDISVGGVGVHLV